MKKQTLPRIVRRETPPKMTGRDGYRKAEPYFRRDFDYRCAYCMVHEQQLGGTKAFCIDHFKPRSKGGHSNDYVNVYWSCIPCNLFKHNKWPTEEQSNKGHRFAEPCREQDYGVHFVESDDCELLPQTPCGEYHVLTLRLNRAWLRRLRFERNQKKERLNEALALLDEIERRVTAQAEDVLLSNRAESETELKLRLLSFLRNEIEALRRELSIAIPLIAPHEDS